MTDPDRPTAGRLRRRILTGLAILVGWAAMGGAIWTIDELAAPAAAVEEPAE